MRSQNDALEPQVFFSDGAAISAESIAVCGGFTEAPEAAVSRIYLKLDATWLAHDVDKDFIVSVAYRDGVLFAVGRNGLVKTVGVRGSSFIPKNVKGRFRSYQVRECDDHGHLARVRAIGDDFFACGWGGQVYRLANDSYQKVDQGIDSLRDDTFLDIGGSTSNDIYAVGMDGLIAHFDGRRWSYLDSPTNNHLFSMRCLSSAEIVVVGANGTLLHGNKKGWQSLSDDAPRENFWDVCKLKQKLYITYGNTGLLSYYRGNWQDVALGDGAKPRTYRLDVAEDRLWSFGSSNLVVYDGKNWQEVICPDNE